MTKEQIKKHQENLIENLVLKGIKRGECEEQQPPTPDYFCRDCGARSGPTRECSGCAHARRMGE